MDLADDPFFEPTKVHLMKEQLDWVLVNHVTVPPS